MVRAWERKTGSRGPGANEPEKLPRSRLVQNSKTKYSFWASRPRSANLISPDGLPRPAEDRPAFERPDDLEKEQVAGRLERGVEDTRAGAADLGVDAVERARA